MIRIDRSSHRAVAGWLQGLALGLAWFHFSPLLAQDLTTPRRALESLLRYSDPSSAEFDIVRAARCFDLQHLPGGDSRGVELARKFQSAIEKLELGVPLERLPDEVAPKEALLPVAEEIPGVFVGRIGSDWRISAASAKAIDRLHVRAFGRYSPRLVQHLPRWATAAPFGVALWQVAAFLVAIVLGWLLRSLVVAQLESRARALAGMAAGQTWVDAVRSAAQPLGWLSIAMLLRLFLPELQFSFAAQRLLSVGLTALGVIAAAWLVYRQIDVLGRYLETLTAKTESRLDDQLVPLVRKVLKFLAAVTALVLLLHNLGINVTSLIAGLGIGGLAVALAAQETLSNFFGSLVILADQPFQIGDAVVIGDVEGTVEQIGLRSTKVRAIDRTLITLPNSKLAAANVRNLGVRKQRFVRQTVGLVYRTSPQQLDAFVAAALAILKAHPRVASEGQNVKLYSMGVSALELWVEFYIDSAEREVELETRHAVWREFMTLPSKLGIEFAYPTQTIQLSKP